MTPPKFHVGQAVVFAKYDSPSPDAAAAGKPSMSKVYHVAEIVPMRHHQTDMCIAGNFLQLEEKPADHLYHESLFAPVELLSDEALAELTESLQPQFA